MQDRAAPRFFYTMAPRLVLNLNKRAYDQGGTASLYMRGLLPELSMVLQSSSLSGYAFGPRVVALEPGSVLLPLLLPLPTPKLSPPLSTNCKDS